MVGAAASVAAGLPLLLLFVLQALVACSSYGPPAIAGLSSPENPSDCCLGNHFPRQADYAGPLHDGLAPEHAKENPDSTVCLHVYDSGHIQLDSALHPGHVPYLPGPVESDGDPLPLVSDFWVHQYVLAPSLYTSECGAYMGRLGQYTLSPEILDKLLGVYSHNFLKGIPSHFCYPIS